MKTVIFASSRYPSLAVLAAACLNEMAFAGLARASAAIPADAARPDDAPSDALALDAPARDFLRGEHIRTDGTPVHALDRDALDRADLVIAIEPIAGARVRVDELWTLPAPAGGASDADPLGALREEVWHLVAERGWWMRKQGVVSDALGERPGTLDGSEITAQAQTSSVRDSH